MNQARNRKIEKLQDIMAAAPPQAAAMEQTDRDALESLADVPTDALKAYFQQQRKQAASLPPVKPDKGGGPFDALGTGRLRGLAGHPHPLVARGAGIALARRDFFQYCSLRAPDFYQPGRHYLVRLCRELQAFYEGRERVMIINLPPRHGKSRTASLFEQWIFGRNPSEKIMTGSYNETLSTTFSKAVRNGIDEGRGDPEQVVYADIFPGVRIQRGDAAMNLWALEGQYASYLATSPGGTATGFGASLIVVDDLIKAAIEAFNEQLLENQWGWFADTMLSRLENGGKILIIMTRWATGDLAGRAERHFRTLGIACRVLRMKAVLDEGTQEMLCPDILSFEDYRMKAGTMSQEILSANYQQIPVDMKGRLYQQFLTYTDIPRGPGGKPLFTAVRAYCDTADQGSDYLCSIIYGVYLGRAYILDAYYTKDGMEVTEAETARRLYEFGVRDADIESNNGGRGFARNVQRILKETFQCVSCFVHWFYQKENKRARILTNSTAVQNNLLFPADWKTRWPDYYEAMFKYQKEGRNAHDDAPDATTGVSERIGQGGVTIRLLGGEESGPEEITDTGQTQPGQPRPFFRRMFGRFSDKPEKWR